MRKIYILLSMLIGISSLSAQQLQFSDSAQVSLLTCSPGEEIYAKFGHTGIRVNDLKNNIDVVFNYGLFSFETKNFYIKFIKGETDYQLGVTSTQAFLAEYIERNSFVWEQKLDLNSLDRKILINSLLINYEPQNRIYRYNFVFDNCATRPRDKILSSNSGIVKLKTSNEPRTFRNWVGVYTGNESWLTFGIDLVFGKPADENASAMVSMFLPEVLMSEFENIYIVTQESGFSEKKLVSEKKVLVEAEYKEVDASNSLIKPFYVFSVLLILSAILTFIETKKRTYYRLFDSTLLLITGLAGILIFYLMFFSAHPLVKNNLNILWLNPLNIFAAIVIWIKPWKFGLTIYKIASIVLLLVSLVLFALSYQSFNYAIFPLIILLLMRYLSYIFNSNRVSIKLKKTNKD
ncbi:MAG: DUF4105 domain-containing protein [Paludibacter sp.]|nr:DUF4105 domain-containing protein [Paludibacter sp.]